MNDAQEVEAAQAQVELAQGSARARAHLEIEARAQVSAIAWRLPACLASSTPRLPRSARICEVWFPMDRRVDSTASFLRFVRTQPSREV